MKTRMLIIAGCVMVAGLVACDQKNEEPATVDTTAVVTPDTIMANPDTTTVTGTPIDTQLINHTDTAITVVKEGKPTTGETKSSGSSKTSTSSGSKSSTNEATGSEPRRSTNEAAGSEVRRTPNTNEGASSERRR